MLVLGRKPGEYIVIDGRITVKVVKTAKGELRLAVDAPREVEIVRGEIYEELGKSPAGAPGVTVKTEKEKVAAKA